VGFALELSLPPLTRDKNDPHYVSASAHEPVSAALAGTTAAIRSADLKR